MCSDYFSRLFLLQASLGTQVFLLQAPLGAQMHETVLKVRGSHLGA